MSIKTMVKIYALFVLLVHGLLLHAQDVLPVERYALYIGSNRGGETRETLRYAGSDAQKLAQLMSEVGGVSTENSIILVDPSKAEIDTTFNQISNTIRSQKNRAKRTEFLLYYSGHSDENAILLGTERYEYAALKTELNKVPSDVHVVMLDSCYSGNFVRAKGGTRQKPFLMDDSSVVQGHAYLSSSSETEASQESDDIQASFFTHALITGLRGAADTSGDKKVSLNELYYYAFNQTLSKTEATNYGPQHPSFNITMVGSGDLVLTDITEAESLIILPTTLEGNCFIRTQKGLLVSEINKIKGTEIALALPAGYYTVALVTATSTTQTSIQLAKKQSLILGNEIFTPLPRVYGRPRGDVDLDSYIEGEASTDVESEKDSSKDLLASIFDSQHKEGFPAKGTVWQPFMFNIFPGWSFPYLANTDYINVSIGAFMTTDKHIQGMQASPFMNIVSGSLEGIQGTVFMNIAAGPMLGVQGSGFMNIASASYQGVQGTGFMNIVRGKMQGVQGSGFMNIAQNGIDGIQGTGFMNVARGGIEGVQAAGYMNIATGKSKALQVSSFMNIANSIDGAQIGFINIAKENNGIALGIFNFIENGIMSPSVYQDSNGNFFIQYQGGTPSFFTSFIAGTKANWGSSWDWDYGILGFGVGFRLFPKHFINFDIEFFNKTIISKEQVKNTAEMIPETEKLISMTDAEQEELIKKIANSYKHFYIPSIRLTGNLNFSQHFSLFSAYNIDIKIKDFNEVAFDYGKHSGSNTISNNVCLYFSWSFGIRF